MSIAIQTLVPSDASALPRGLNTRAQNVKPNSCGILFGKYHFSANAHSSRFASGPKITNATRPSTTAMPSACGQRVRTRSRGRLRALMPKRLPRFRVPQVEPRAAGGDHAAT